MWRKVLTSVTVYWRRKNLQEHIEMLYEMFMSLNCNVFTVALLSVGNILRSNRTRLLTSEAHFAFHFVTSKKTLDQDSTFKIVTNILLQTLCRFLKYCLIPRLTIMKSRFLSTSYYCSPQSLLIKHETASRGNLNKMLFFLLGQNLDIDDIISLL